MDAPTGQLAPATTNDLPILNPAPGERKRGVPNESRLRLISRIGNYLQAGGLFNPELMEHEKVRGLLMDCQAYLVHAKLESENAELRSKLEQVEKRFPMQDGPTIPWSLAELLYVGYSACYGTSQSLNRLSERGGWGWAEIAHFWAQKNGTFRRAINNARAASLDVKEGGE